jgi:threonine synthase
MGVAYYHDMHFVKHLECAFCGQIYRTDRVVGLCESCARPLWVKYDIDALRGSVDRDSLKQRPETMWRYAEMLPVFQPESIVSLGETMTPLIPATRLGPFLGLKNLLIKDESRLPTGSFKARGMAMAVSKAAELGVKSVAVPTAGNAGGALAAYAARAGLAAHVFMPHDTPVINQRETALLGAKTITINGLIDDCGRLVREGMPHMGWFDMSTLKEPYRIEGKKTMGLELAEQLDWVLPDVILYPTGGGTGLIGMWKAFSELAEMGWLESENRPKMIACQSSGCDPIVRAFEAGLRHADRVVAPKTMAAGIRVPVAVGDFMILDAVRESGGVAVRGEEDKIPFWMEKASQLEGVSLCPESAICLATLGQLLSDGVISPSDRVVLFNTGAAQKYLEVLPQNQIQIDFSAEKWWEDLC